MFHQQLEPPPHRTHAGQNISNYHSTLPKVLQPPNYKAFALILLLIILLRPTRLSFHATSTKKRLRSTTTSRPSTTGFRLNGVGLA